MKHMEYLHNSPILGIAHHKIVLDDCGTPVDYEFLEVNASFSTMTGLQHKNLIGKTVREAIPGIDTSGFDWIGCFGAIALNGGDKVFEEFSEPLGKWYRVHVYSTEPLYFTTVFIDITEPVLQNQEKDQDGNSKSGFHRFSE